MGRFSRRIHCLPKVLNNSFGALLVKDPRLTPLHSEDRHFQAGSPLSGDTPLYIERKADHEALVRLRNMDYISFIEPRLQGKTSLIYRLMKQLSPKGYAFVVCDLVNERFRKHSEEEWYRSLSEWVMNNLNFITGETQASLPTNSTTWQTFLEAIATGSERSKSEGRDRP